VSQAVLGEFFSLVVVFINCADLVLICLGSLLLLVASCAPVVGALSEHKDKQKDKRRPVVLEASEGAPEQAKWAVSLCSWPRSCWPGGDKERQRHDDNGAQ